MSDWFYPNDKVRINLEGSSCHDKIGFVTNPLGAQSKVRCLDDKEQECEYFYWNDELILIERTWPTK